MRIKNIMKEELRHMNGREGLVLRGCGGSLKEWISGINEILTKEAILLEGSRFHQAISFQSEGCTNLLFLFSEAVKLDLGKLALWKIKTAGAFNGIWLSDYVENHLGGFAEAKPDCPLIGENGNVFNLIEIVRRTLRENDLAYQSEEFCQRAFAAKSYNGVLSIISEYVNITASGYIDDGMEALLEEEEVRGISL